MMLLPCLFARSVRVKGYHTAVAVESLAAILALDQVEAANCLARLNDVLEAAMAPSPSPIIEYFER